MMVTLREKGHAFEVIIVALVYTCEYSSLQKHKSKNNHAHTIMLCCAVLQVSTNSTW